MAKWTCHVALSPTPGTDGLDWMVDEQQTSQQPVSLKTGGTEACPRVEGTGPGASQATSEPRFKLCRLQLVLSTRHLGTQRTDCGETMGALLTPPAQQMVWGTYKPSEEPPPCRCSQARDFYILPLPCSHGPSVCS